MKTIDELDSEVVALRNVFVEQIIELCRAAGLSTDDDGGPLSGMRSIYRPASAQGKPLAVAGQASPVDGIAAPAQDTPGKSLLSIYAREKKR